MIVVSEMFDNPQLFQMNELKMFPKRKLSDELFFHLSSSSEHDSSSISGTRRSV